MKELRAAGRRGSSGHQLPGVRRDLRGRRGPVYARPVLRRRRESMVPADIYKDYSTEEEVILATNLFAEARLPGAKRGVLLRP